MIIAVASGKGGTGKTLIATSLALSLKDREHVQLLDCDVEEPNDHIFIRPQITSSQPVTVPVPFIDESKCTHCGTCADVCAYNAIAVGPQYILTFPELCHGCGACSYFCPAHAITEVPQEIGLLEQGTADGLEFAHGKLAIGKAMAPPVIRKVKELAAKDGLVIIDSSPGTSCPVVEAIKDSDFCLLVTEPTPFGLNDLMLAVETVRILGIPCGIVLNRADVGDKKTQEYCRREGIPILMTIPLDTRIASLYSRGISIAEGMPEYRQEFIELYEKIGEMVHAGSSSSER